MGKKFGVIFLTILICIIFTGCTNNNSTNSNKYETSNTVTLVDSIKMFDFSKAKYITERSDNEDIGVILVTNSGNARLYAYNGAEMKKQQDTTYSTILDISRSR